MNARLGKKPRRDEFWGPGERRKRRWPLRIVIVSGFVLFFVGVAYVADRGVDWYTARSETTTTTAEEATAAAIKVVVDSGMSTAEIGRVLEQKGVIESSSAFVDLVKARGSENRLRPGSYQFNKGEKLLTVVDMLEQGKAAPSLKLTIPEGKSIDQVADLLNEKASIDGDTYAALGAKPSEFDVPKVGAPPRSSRHSKACCSPAHTTCMRGMEHPTSSPPSWAPSDPGRLI